jgi:Ti-type conjugative transfer relaxase TraA
VATYHFTAKIVCRSHGRSVVGAAAYRAGIRLREDGTQIVYDYTRKPGVEHTEILAPDHAPAWVFDRSRLWNTVDQVEKRKDAQLARDIEIALPIELDKNAQVDLLRDFVRREFVSKGMIADCAIHRDNPNNPHAHVLLTLRHIGKNGFGLKERSWNTTSQLLAWRLAWAEVANTHLAKAGLGARIDHRTLEAQGLDLIPTSKIGVSLERQKSDRLPPRIAERVAEHRAIAAENGSNIVADPGIAIKALTHYNATFTEHDIAKFLHTRTDGAEQFDAAYLKVTTHPELVLLGEDDRGRRRFTSREMLEVEERMLNDTELLSQRNGHNVAAAWTAEAASQSNFSSEQLEAYEHLVGAGDLKVLVGIAGSGKSRLLSAAREAWEAQGYTVKGAALAGIAAENLETDAGISSRTLASYELAWQGGRDPLTSNDILVIDEAGMLGTRQMERMLDAAESAGAKVVLVGDPEQLAAIEAGAALRGIISESGFVELTEVRRQKKDWHKAATQLLSKGKTGRALSDYERKGFMIQTATRDVARSTLVNRWAQDAKEHPDQTRLMLAYTREDVRKLNNLAREVRRQRGELGHAEVIKTERGPREFAVHDRLYFLRNERSLGVKNGTLGTIERVENGVLQVKLDKQKRTVQVDTRFYRDLDHGYAATIHKGQGVTVDRSYVLATSHFDRHATYVALSRHREDATLVYATEDFAPPSWSNVPATPETARQNFLARVSRDRPKELAYDYLERGDSDSFHYIDVRDLEPEQRSWRQKVATDLRPKSPSPRRSMMSEIDALQQRGAEKWREQQRAREASGTRLDGLHQEKELPLDNSPSLDSDSPHHPPLEYPGAEEDFEL